MTRTDILTVAVVAATLSGVTWWLQRQPVEGPTPESVFVSVDLCPVGFWARFDGDRYTCWKDDPQGPCPQGQQWGVVSYTDGGSGYACVAPSLTVSTGGADMVAIVASDGPISDTMLVFDPERLELIIGTSGMPIAWIEPTGGPNGKPRVRIKNGRVADTVRALALMAIQPRPCSGTVTCNGEPTTVTWHDPDVGAVAEWVGRLEK